MRKAISFALMCAIRGQEFRRAKSSGLGLAITRRLVELQGGQISVETRPNEGCCFSFTLPKGLISPSTAQHRTPAPHHPTQLSVLRSDGYVLIVEDDGATR